MLWLISILPCQAQERTTPVGLVKVLDGLNFPEGPAWDGQILYASNCHGDWITRVAEDTQHIFLKAQQQPFTFAKTNGMTVYRDGSLFACDFGCGAILKISPQGVTEIYASGYQGKRFNRPNDLAFDPHGNLYFTDPNAYDPKNRDGVVYRIDAKTRRVRPVAGDLGFPNGIAFSQNAKFLYVCESALNRILKYRVKKDGSLDQRTVFAELPGGDPDGIALDVKGRLYAAHFGGAAVYIFNDKGRIEKILQMPGKKPTNLEFGDADLRTLYITETETNAIYKMRVDTPGLALFCAPVKKNP